MEHEDHEGHKDHEERPGIPFELERVGRQIVDAGIKVHTALGPGLLEAVYEQCLAHELTVRGLEVRRQVGLPVVYDGVRVDAGYRLDLLVANTVIVEVKAVEALSRLYEAQVLTYLRSGYAWPIL